MDRSEGAQQNEGCNIPAHTGSDPAVRHAAGGPEQAHGLITGEVKQEASVSQYGRLAHRRLKHPQWSLHDIRRTFTTMLNDLGVDPHVVEQLTGHQMPGMQRVYNHSRYLDAKRDALDMWTERLGILAGAHENVTTLPVTRIK